jgi:HlyD family secretion protein
MSSKVRWIIAAVVVIALIAAGYFWMQYQAQVAASGEYQTQKAGRGSLTASVGATGTVRAVQSALMNWQTSGTVSIVNVKIGDMVKKGDVLAALDKASLSQAVILAEADLVNAQKALDDLLKSGTPFAKAQLALVQAQQDYDDAKEKRDRLNYDRASAETVEDAYSDYVVAQDRVELMDKFYRRELDKPADNPARAQAYSNYYNALEARDNALALYLWYKGEPSASDIVEADANFALAQAQLEDAQREHDRLKDGPDARDILAAEARINAAQATVNLSRVIAPFDGIVTQVEPLAGDQVGAGALAFRVDDLSHLLVDVQVSEIDINTIGMSQQVMLTFDAILGKEYVGKVVEVGQVGTVVQGAVNFNVTVELVDADAAVKPGMTAAVTITVKEINDVLLVPNRAVRILDGQRIVYVLKDGLPVEVEIRLGASSDTVSEVVGGDLKEGDLIILNPPTIFVGPMGGGRPGGN